LAEEARHEMVPFILRGFYDLAEQGWELLAEVAGGTPAQLWKGAAWRAVNFQGGTFGVVGSSLCGVVLARGVLLPSSKAVRPNNRVLLEARRAAAVGSGCGAESGDDGAGFCTRSALSLKTGMALLSLPTGVLVPCPALSLPTGLVPGGCCTMAALSLPSWKRSTFRI
jgi:hypothetical protein